MAKPTKTAGNALKALKIERILKPAQFSDALYRKSDADVIRAVEEAQRAVDSAQRALREFMYEWRFAVPYAERGGAVSFPPSTGINPAPRPVVVSVKTPGGGQAQGGTHAPRPTFPPSATSGEAKGGKRKPGGRR